MSLPSRISTVRIPLDLAGQTSQQRQRSLQRRRGGISHGIRPRDKVCRAGGRQCPNLPLNRRFVTYDGQSRGCLHSLSLKHPLIVRQPAVHLECRGRLFTRRRHVIGDRDGQQYANPRLRPARRLSRSVDLRHVVRRDRLWAGPREDRAVGDLPGDSQHHRRQA